MRPSPSLRGGAQATGPSALRGVAVLVGLVLAICLLAKRVDDGADQMVAKLGKIEVTARLLERPEQFPELGAYRYTYVLKYQVLKVHRPDAAGKYPLKPGDIIYVGHYKPWMPRNEVKDADWGEDPLGGRATQFVVGEAQRMALDYELANLAPSGVLDYCYPQQVNRFFAVWVNPSGM